MSNRAPSVFTSSRRRIVIVGGGFAGVYAARAMHGELARLGREAEEWEVVLVSRDNYFVFQPMLPEVISGSIGILDTVSPLRRLLPRTRIVVREVEKICLRSRTVRTAPGVHPHAGVIPFDHLVLAVGTTCDFRGLPGLAEHALPLRNLADAIALRNRAIGALEEAAVEDDPLLRRQLLTFVVAGGGFSGVEVAAELNDFVRAVARHYPSIADELRVVLLHSQERILPEVSPRLANFAEGILTRRGVELRLGRRLEAATAEAALVTGGERIPTRTLVSTVPASPQPLIDALDLPKSRSGRVRVGRHLEVEGHPGVWALGDCAEVPMGEGGFAPPTAQHAIRQARTLAANVVASIRGAARRDFAFGGYGRMGSLGHRCAVAEIMGVPFSGFVAWWIWRTVYLAKLPGWGRRLKVAVSWTLDLFLPPELVQMRAGLAPGLCREHYEPGQVVFHEGDVGDSVFAIIAGRAQVTRVAGGAEASVAFLGEGQVFGEMALLGGGARGATVRCVEAMDVVRIPRRDFHLLEASLPAFRRGLEEVAAARERPRGAA